METPHEAQKTCALITKYGTDVSGGIEKYDIRYFESNNTAQDVVLEEYLNRKEV